ncbi:hypothetical protein C0Q70_15608 [Pomacea canaliculata]|uniref:Uncharacterized protein n=1 Tax=Pomacea canaliculata TaxID=400727 RepID=A0A2T7NVB5_POMCA|nr:hypothetical protein C0Q70_15608 [Pomacea canaliculata]
MKTADTEIKQIYLSGVELFAEPTACLLDARVSDVRDNVGRFRNVQPLQAVDGGEAVGVQWGEEEECKTTTLTHVCTDMHQHERLLAHENSLTNERMEACKIRDCLLWMTICKKASV